MTEIGEQTGRLDETMEVIGGILPEGRRNIRCGQECSGLIRLTMLGIVVSGIVAVLFIKSYASI